MCLLAEVSGVPAWVSTTTNSCSTGISCTYAAGAWSFTNTSPFVDPFTHASYGGQTTSATSSTLWLTNTTVSLAASSSVLTYASSTTFSASGSGYFGTTNTAASWLAVGTTTPWGLF